MKHCRRHWHGPLRPRDNRIVLRTACGAYQHVRMRGTPPHRVTMPLYNTLRVYSWMEEEELPAHYKPPPVREFEMAFDRCDKCRTYVYQEIYRES